MLITEKEVSEYMCKIMPKNWHVLTNLNRNDKKPGHLYIQILVFDKNKGPMGDCSSLYYSNERAGLVWINIYYQDQWQYTIIHELSHIAVNRWWSWKTKNDCLVHYRAGKRIKHDKFFKKALNTFWKRARDKGLIIIQ